MAPNPLDLDDDQLVPTPQAAPLLHVHEVTLRRHIRSGLVPGVRIGHRYFVSTKTLRRLLADRNGAA